LDRLKNYGGGGGWPIILVTWSLILAQGALWYQNKNWVLWELCMGNVCFVARTQGDVQIRWIGLNVFTPLVSLLGFWGVFLFLFFRSILPYVRYPLFFFFVGECAGVLYIYFLKIYSPLSTFLTLFITPGGMWELMTDLAQTIISDVKPEIFKKHTKDLVRTYWEQLIQLGVSEKEYLQASSLSLPSSFPPPSPQSHFLYSPSLVELILFIF
jgi:hypothetical protein